MIKDLDELIVYLRRTLPQPKAIQQLKANEEGNYVTFQWNSRSFLVRQNLQVLEIKSGRVFITGASTLMQSTLMVKNHHQKAIEGIVEDLSQAEEMINGPYRRDQGLRLLDGVKKTLARLSGAGAKRRNGRATVAARASQAA